MVFPTLRRQHSLKGVNILPVIRRFKDVDASTVVEFARVTTSKKTEEMAMEDLLKHIQDLIDDEMKPEEIFDLARRDFTCHNARLLLHCLIVHANEFGQPRGQNIITQAKDPIQGVVTEDGSQVKRMKVDDNCSQALEKRIVELEKLSKGGAVTQLKEKVRVLCLMQEPSEPLILLTLDELSRLSRSVGHEEADTFEELARQANRHRGKINISSLCLSVMGGKAADTITKALSKCVKEKQIESKVENMVKSETQVKHEPSPLTNLYPSNQFPYQTALSFSPYPGYMYPGFPHISQFQGGNRQAKGSWGGQRYQGQRQRGACLFCESTEHLIRDCEKMKQAKRKSWKEHL